MLRVGDDMMRFVAEAYAHLCCQVASANTIIVDSAGSERIGIRLAFSGIARRHDWRLELFVSKNEATFSFYCQ